MSLVVRSKPPDSDVWISNPTLATPKAAIQHAKRLQDRGWHALVLQNRRVIFDTSDTGEDLNP